MLLCDIFEGKALPVIASDELVVESEEAVAVFVPPDRDVVTETLFPNDEIAGAEGAVCPPDNDEVEALVVTHTVLVLSVTFEFKEGILTSIADTVLAGREADDATILEILSVGGRIDFVDNAVLSPDRGKPKPESACPNKLCFVTEGFRVALEFANEDCPPNSGVVIDAVLKRLEEFADVVVLKPEDNSTPLPNRTLPEVFATVTVEIPVS